MSTDTMLATVNVTDASGLDSWTSSWSSPTIRAVGEHAYAWTVSASASLEDDDLQDIDESDLVKHNEAIRAELQRLGSRMLAQRVLIALNDGTANRLLVPPKRPSTTMIQLVTATDEARITRWRNHAAHAASADDHQSKYLDEWQQRIKQYSERSHEEMLEGLRAGGLSWRNIARLLKVSIGAVQKWRSGDQMSATNFARLRDFIAAYDTVATHKPEVNLASWLYVPLLTDVPLTPLDLWTKGNPTTFFEYTLGSLSADAALDAVEPEWRRHYREDGFVTFRAQDGNLSIGYKNH